MDRKLVTTQKINKLNDVFAIDSIGNGGANHEYAIVEKDSPTGEPYVVIQLQNGARNESGSVNGVIDSDLLEIVKDRLGAFQNGDYATVENEKAYFHICEALLWLNKRVEDRAERGVLGYNQK